MLEEGDSTVGTVSATEPFGEIISFGLSNVGDHAQFDIDPLSGELSFISIPDYESPGDANADNIYEITVTANGSDGSSSATFEIEVLDRNEAPTDFALSNTSVSEQIQTEVGVLSATDYHGIGADFTIVGGADQGAFSVDPNADTLSFINAPNYEAPLDADGDNVYEVTITAANIHGSVTETFNISVINLSEKPTDFVLSNTRIDENQTSVGFFSATDEFGGAVTFENTGGWDGAFFDVDEDTGELSFKSAPDYETPLDRDGNNRYRVKVKASSTTGTNEIQFDINVSNVYDAPNAPTLSTTEVEENTTYVGLVSAVGESGSTITYQLVGGGDSSNFTLNAETGALSFVSGPNYENPLDADGDNLYEIYVIASDSELDSPTAQFSIRVLDVNEAPIFYGLQSFNLSENETDVDPLQASDPEGSALTYSIVGGDDAGFFTIHPTSGYLTFVAAPDYEAPQDADTNNSYTVDVAASDGELSSVISVTVLVQNIDDINVDYFRSHYGLNEDGSDDAVDWSGNGIANILYFAFGLGDPNETSVDRSRLPALTSVSDYGDYAFSYIQPQADGSLDIALKTSDDLTTSFVDLDTLGTEYQPVETETESLGDDYERITQHFDLVSGEEALFYRIEVEVSNSASE